jgi:hypothetical protein
MPMVGVCSSVLEIIYYLLRAMGGRRFEMLAAEIKGSDPKYTWEAVGIYRAPNDDIRFIEKLAERTGRKNVAHNNGVSTIHKRI